MLPRSARPAFGLPLLIAAAALGGCAALVSEPPPHSLGASQPEGALQGSLKDDAPHAPHFAPATPRRAAAADAGRADCGSDSECLVRLKALVEDPRRAWVGQARRPVEYAQGVRLFAYRALRGKLSCRELSLALAEIEAQAGAYRQPVSGITPDQAARVRTLTGEVEGELRVERASRCGG